ncbi:hypothetical protein JCM11251_006730 [Rhodosporidiobolus azoricus]
MDFLTQPFRPPPRRKSDSGSPPPPEQPPSPTRGSTRKDSLSSCGSSQASSEASTSHTPVHLDHCARFSLLRTAAPLAPNADGLPNEKRLPYPSDQAGDWQAFGRVQGRVVVWEKGTIGVVGEKQMREDEKGVAEWVVEGKLWLTKSEQILLILDRDHFPPLPIDRAAALSARTSRPPSRPSSSRGFNGLSGLARRLSRTESGASTPVAGGRRRSSVGSFGAGAAEAAGGSIAADADEQTAADGSKSSVRGFLKRVASPFRRDKANEAGSGDDRSLRLERTRSTEVERRRASEHRAQITAQAPVQAQKQTITAGFPEDRELSSAIDDDDEEDEGVGGWAGGLPGAAVTFEEPNGRDRGPLPDYKGYPITALLIPSPLHIHTIRFYPAQTGSSSSHTSSFFGGSSAPDEPITTVPPSTSNSGSQALEGTIGLDALLAGGGGTVEGMEWKPPVVEVDVFEPIDDSGISAGDEDAQEEGNKAREVTIGFVFKEVLLAQEATTFYNRLLALLPPTHPQAHSPTRGRSPSPSQEHSGVGNALMRTLTGGLSRERSRELQLPGRATAAAASRERERSRDRRGKVK